MAEEDFKLRVLHQGWDTFGIATIALPGGGHVDRAFEHHGEAACVLPFDADRRVAILVRQMRVGPRYWGETEDIDEAPAGSLDDEPAEVAARREVLEEAGVRLGPLDFVVRSYPMPSVSSERLYLYLAAYTAADRIAAGGGLAAEGEMLTVREVPLAELGAMADAGRLTDMKTLVLVQALRRRRPELFD